MHVLVIIYAVVLICSVVYNTCVATCRSLKIIGQVLVFIFVLEDLVFVVFLVGPVLNC